MDHTVEVDETGLNCADLKLPDILSYAYCINFIYLTIALWFFC